MLAKKSDNRSTENTNGKSAQKPKKKKTRTTFTAYQLEELERAFERAPYPGNNKIKAFLGLIHFNIYKYSNSNLCKMLYYN